MTTIRRREGEGDRLAVMLPGANYTPARPLLHFVATTLLARGWTVVEVWWEPPEQLGRPVEWVRSEVEHHLDRELAMSPLIIAKSLGTLALPLAADRRLAGVWLTPLVHFDAVTDALSRQKAPTLLVAGAADPSWEGSATGIGEHRTVVLEEADHGLEVRRDPHRSLAHLATIVDEVGRFADSIGPAA